MTVDSVIYNPTPYTASPSIRFSFSNGGEGGSITINGRTISVQVPHTVDDIVIDCAKQDIYLLDTRQNLNNLFVLSDGEFFELYPGRNSVYFTGMNANVIHVTPNWWTV